MNKTNKKFKDPGSAITHLIAMIGAVICAFPLIGKAVHTNNSNRCFCHVVYLFSSMILLYGASTFTILWIFQKKVNLSSEDRSFHDFRADCRFLHTSLLTGTR